MKCEFCGQSLSLEEAACPYCGQPNPHARQHVQDMNRYKGDYEKTKKGVYAATGKYAQITVRAVIITVLVILIAVMLYVNNNVYHLQREHLRNGTRRNAKEYTALLDQYMQEEDFRRIALLADERAISISMEEYEAYAPVIAASRDYTWFCNSLMGMVTEPLEEGETPKWSYMVEQLNYFYDAIDLSGYEYYEGADSPENRKALETMENNVELMLQTYLGLTEEEVAGLRDMSEARRTVLFEEKYE